MSNPGSLIQLHHHDNYELLEQLKDTNGILYYKDAPVFPGVSKKENNGITLETDGLYMSSLTMLNATQYNLVSRFDYQNGALLFDGMIVSQEYTNLQIRMMIDTLWEDLNEEVIIPDTNMDNMTGGTTGDTTDDNETDTGSSGSNNNTIITGDFITQETMETYVQQAMTDLVNAAVGEESGGDTSDATES